MAELRWTNHSDNDWQQGYIIIQHFLQSFSRQCYISPWTNFLHVQLTFRTNKELFNSQRLHSKTSLKHVDKLRGQASVIEDKFTEAQDGPCI